MSTNFCALVHLLKLFCSLCFVWYIFFFFSTFAWHLAISKCEKIGIFAWSKNNNNNKNNNKLYEKKMLMLFSLLLVLTLSFWCMFCTFDDYTWCAFTIGWNGKFETREHQHRQFVFKSERNSTFFRCELRFRMILSERKNGTFNEKKNIELSREPHKLWGISIWWISMHMKCGILFVCFRFHFTWVFVVGLSIASQNAIRSQAHSRQMSLNAGKTQLLFFFSVLSLSFSSFTHKHQFIIIIPILPS